MSGAGGVVRVGDADWAGHEPSRDAYRPDGDHPVARMGIRNRSALAITRNPLLALPGAAALRDMPDDQRISLAIALRSIQADARVRADKCWRTHKAPMAVYWKAVGVYCGHLARVLSSDRQAA